MMTDTDIICENRHILKDNSMMKDCFIDEGIYRINIDQQKVLFTHYYTTPSMCEIPPVYGNNKQQQIINIFRGKINVFSFSNKLVFLENPMYA